MRHDCPTRFRALSATWNTLSGIHGGSPICMMHYEYLGFISIVLSNHDPNSLKPMNRTYAWAQDVGVFRMLPATLRTFLFIYYVILLAVYWIFMTQSINRSLIVHGSWPRERPGLNPARGRRRGGEAWGGGGGWRPWGLGRGPSLVMKHELWTIKKRIINWSINIRFIKWDWSRFRWHQLGSILFGSYQIRFILFCAYQRDARESVQNKQD